MSDLTPQLDFDVGLVQITFQQEADAPSSSRLPFESIAPSDLHFELQLEEVLNSPASQERRLLAALQPQVTHREVLKPWVFNTMVNQVLVWLQAKSRSSVPAEERRKFRRAAQTLEEFDALAILLRRFQHALHRG